MEKNKYSASLKAKLATRQNKNYKNKQFAGNLHEGQGYADRRKTKATHAYVKLLKKEGRSLAEFSKRTEKIYRENAEETKIDCNKPKSQAVESSAAWTSQSGNTKSRYDKAVGTWKKKNDDATKKKEAESVQRKERAEALERYVQSKKNSYKKLCKRNYKGQPIMASQMDLLLQRITKNREKK